MTSRSYSHISKNTAQSGNIFFAIFGAIALVGLLGAAVMTFMKGPLSTAVKLTKSNTAEVQMTIGAQVAVMSTTSQANSGDCDSDGFVEPMPWRAATTEPIPVNGGLVPLTLGISKKDPWGTEYGYCVWNHGAVTSGGTCGANMLTGTSSTAYPVVAIVSAGPDKAFTTTCRTFASADANSDGDLDDAADNPLVSKAAETDDDIIQTFTYEEATAASGGLWSLKSGDPATAVISKKIESTGLAEFQGGVLLPDSSLITCDATTAGVMAKNASGTGIEICDGTGSWTAISGGGGASESFTGDMTAVCNAGNAGKVRYNSTTFEPEFCNGTTWLPFTLSPPTGSLIILPTYNYSMDLTGPCSGGDCPYKYGSWVTFTVYNKSNTPTGTLTAPSITGTGSTNYEIDAATSTCDDAVSLAKAGASGDSCVIKLRAKASGNGTYSANLVVTTGAVTALAPLYGLATGFTCGSGTYGWGGYVVGPCTGAGGTEPGTGQLILQEAGCSSSTSEPACTGVSTSDPTFSWMTTNVYPDAATSNFGDVNTVTVLSYPSTFNAAQYCNNLIKGGYDNWYLPSRMELLSFYSDSVVRSLFASAYYWSSTYYASGTSYYVDVANNYSSNAVPTNSYRVRCVRKHNSTMPSATTDDDPLWEYLGYGYRNYPYFGSGWGTGPIGYSATAGVQVISPSIKIYGFNTPITMSISGPGTPQFRINGGAWQTSASISPLTPPMTVELSTTSPSVGSESVVTFTAGKDSTAWKVRTYDTTVTKKIFTTSTSYTGNLGGLSGADTICQTRAAAGGLANASTYRAFLNSKTSDGLANIGWKWGTLQTVNGTTVVSSPGSLLSGSLTAAPSRDEYGNLRSTSVWTAGYGNNPIFGMTTSMYFAADRSCSDWTVGTSSDYSYPGTSSSITSTALNTGTSLTCNNSAALYCIGPNPETTVVTCPGAVNTTASKNAAGSYSVTIPAGCAVTFKLWGGTGGTSDCNASNYPGGGGYALYTATPVTDTTYYYTVGGGGGSNSGGSSEAGFSGGNGGWYTTYAHGGGGGATVLREGGASGTILAVAGGGGGERVYSSTHGLAGGASGNTYSASSSGGSAGVTDGAGNGSPGSGGGYDGATGGGGLSDWTGANGSGGSNWVTAGVGNTTLVGVGPYPGNASDTDKSSLGWTNTGYANACWGGRDGGVIVIY